MYIKYLLLYTTLYIMGMAFAWVCTGINILTPYKSIYLYFSNSNNSSANVSSKNGNAIRFDCFCVGFDEINKVVPEQRKLLRIFDECEWECGAMASLLCKGVSLCFWCHWLR